MARMTEPLVLKDVCFRYAERLILDHCSLKIDTGKIYCFLGRNGSGKSTLIRLLNGSLAAESGTVSIGAKATRRMTKKEKARYIAYVPQSGQGFFNYDVPDLVVMGRNPYMKFWERPGANDYNKAEDIMSFLNIGHLRQRRFQELSGGEKQLVLITQAIAQEAAYLLLDEPTSHLDFYYQHQVLSAMKKITSQGRQAAIITMHDPNLTYLFADHIFMLQNGRIIASGTPEETLNAELLSSLYNMPVQLERTAAGHTSIYSICSITRGEN